MDTIPKFKLDSWMSLLPNNAKLTQLSIPGTHNSCAMQDFGNAGFVQNQTEFISWQLNNGIRYLDIRCRNTHISRGPFAHHKERWMFKIYHGIIDLQRTFDGVLDACVDFLSKHPSETILMRVQQEGSSENDRYKNIFYKYIVKYGATKFYVVSAMPTLQQVRGRIVLLTALPWINMGLWFLGQEIQDEYSHPSLDDKAEKIIEHIVKSISNGGREKLFINHFSATGPLLARTPWYYAKTINKYMLRRVRDRFRMATQLGVLVYDYAGASSGQWGAKDNLLAQAIIERNNFVPTSVQEPAIPDDLTR